VLTFSVSTRSRPLPACPEPWMGEPNSLNSGKATVKLGPGDEFGWEMCVTASNWPCLTAT